MTTQAAWVLMAGFLAMFTHLGFALAETGLCRAKNAVHTMSMNLMVYALACLAFWGYGFALGWGNCGCGPAGAAPYAALGEGTTALDAGLGIGTARAPVSTQGDSPIFGPTLRVSARKSGQSPGGYRYGLLGLKGFFLAGIDSSSLLTLFFFMAVAMSVSATIPTGTLSERWAWRNFCLYGLWFVLPYCVYANWVWGGGWLAQMGVNWHLGHGAVDFAGSGVVHALGGVVACAGASRHGAAAGQISARPPATAARPPRGHDRGRHAGLGRGMVRPERRSCPLGRQRGAEPGGGQHRAGQRGRGRGRHAHALRQAA